jgi:alpha-mannosidase
MQNVAEVRVSALAGLLAATEAAMYQAVAPLSVVAWITPEPVPFDRRESGKRMILGLGDRWGSRIFDCGWFLFEAALPRGLQEPLFVRIDINGELCLVDEGGRPVRGLTCVKSIFDRRLGCPGKTIYALPPDTIRQAHLALWGDAGFNDLFGCLCGNGVVEMAEVCVCRQDTRALHYDLSVLGDYAAGLPPEHPTSRELEAVLGALAIHPDPTSPAWVESARGWLRPFFIPDVPRSPLKVRALGHSHLDLAWLWPVRETIRKAARTFATALYNIERYPLYVFGASQPQQYAWVKQHYPDLYRRIRDAVRAGRIEPLGAMWVEPDCNVPSGESLVRQILHGQRFYREEFGVEVRNCWLPDTFGFNAQLPQILSRSGIRYFMTMKIAWNQVNRFPHHSFRWAGLDGSEVLAHLLPEETYASPATPQSLRKIGANYAQRDVSRHALMVYGIGDGGGGPDAEHLERIARAQTLGDLPTPELGSAAEFFEQWKEDADAFPQWKGELYLERHQGCFTTQAAVKRNNRLSEIALREAEWAAVLAERLADRPYPVAELDAIWKDVLLYQFHDILPGSSIKRVYDECAPRYAQILEQLAGLVARSYAALGPGVYNSLPWPRREWLKLAEQWYWVDVPGLGCGTLTEAPLPAVVARERLLENELLRVGFAADGTLASVWDKETGREVLAAGEAGNRFVVFDDGGDAWDFPMTYLDQTPRFPQLVAAVPRVDGPCAVMEQVWRIGRSEIRQAIILKTGSRQLEFDTQVDWHEEKAMLRVRFPVAVATPEARFEIPFGSIRRPTHEDDSWAKAQLEVFAHQWVDLAQSDYGVALLNDCKYGHRVKGHTLDLNLIRSVPHPDVALISKEDRSEDGHGPMTDQGRHVFRYALLPHDGGWSESDLTRAARVFNTPLHHVPGAGGRRVFLELDPPGIEIAAVKRAEDGRGFIVRLCRLESTPCHARVRMKIPYCEARETDMMEADLGPVDLASLNFGPCEIKTLRII